MYQLESLEDRQLLAWGTYPHLIQQDQAVTSYASTTGNGVNIALIDSGVDFNQPNLQGKFWTNPGEIAGNGIDDDGDGYKDDTKGWDFYNNDNVPEDQNGHGTAMAGIMTASQFTFNGATYQGIATGAKIIPLKVADPTGAYSLAFAQRVEKALQWVETNYQKYNIRIVSMSIRTPLADYNNTYADEVSRLAAKGVFIVAAGGQEDPNLDVEYPARDPNVFGVSVVEANDKFPIDDVNRGPGIDLLAPGDAVPILKRTSGFTTSAEATSYATPFVSATAALLRQVNPSLTIAQLTSILKNSGSDVTDTSTGFTFSGRTYKRLNVYKAIQAAMATVQVGSQPPSTAASSNGIAYSANGVLHLAYYNDSSQELKYATRATNGTWSSVTTIDGGDQAGQFVSLALDDDDHPGIAYYDADNGDLKYAHFNGSTWSVGTVDSANTTGYYPSLQFDGNNRPVISYYYKTGGDLRFAAFNGSAWAISTIDSAGNVGRYSSLAANPGTGRWSVAYEDTGNGWFKYADQGKTKWAATVVDNTTKIAGGYNSLVFNPKTDRATFSYYDAFNGDLKLATFNGSSWVKQTVASKGTVGLYSNLLIEDDGTADILYYSRNADSVIRATPSGSTWNLTQITTDGGKWISRAVNASGTQTLAYVKGSAVVTTNV